MGEQIILCEGFEVVPPPKMNDLILFGSEQSGSNCDESTVTTEEDCTVFSGDSSPGGGQAEEEWSRSKLYSFYLVKQPNYDDPEIKSEINEADSEIYYCNKRRIELSINQKSQRVEITSLFTQMERLVPKAEGYKKVLKEKKKEFDTLHESLRCSSNSDQLCFSKEELDHLIYIAHYVIEHGSNGLEEEDWVLKKTEKPDEIILNQDSLAQKEASIYRVKSMAVEMNEVKKELDAITWQMNHLSDKIRKSQNKKRNLDVEMALILEKRDTFYDKIKKLRVTRDKRNAAFYQSLAVIRKAKELAVTGNTRDLEEFASSEVDRFMNQWNNDKSFRDDYVKRSSVSQYERQLGIDGRIREHEVVQENQEPVKTCKENQEPVQDGNVKKEVRKKVKDSNRSSADESDVTDLEFPVYAIGKKKEEEEVDEETIKERKREEQLEKARLAMERKRKLQEKAASKAALRAQKEAEKKLKECEKKAAKKKAAANSSSPSKVIDEVEKVRTLGKERALVPKQKLYGYKQRGKGTESLPKVILNRRKIRRYWIWGVSSAALAIALFLVFLLLR